MVLERCARVNCCYVLVLSCRGGVYIDEIYLVFL